MKFFERFKTKKPVYPIVEKTPYDIAHDLYCQMIQRPVTEHDEIVYTFMRLHYPGKHIHSNPIKKHKEPFSKKEAA